LLAISAGYIRLYNGGMALYRGRYRVNSAHLSGWDYSSAGYYYVTICTKGKIPFFGEVEDEEEEST
jgi:hypothetical protein